MIIQLTSKAKILKVDLAIPSQICFASIFIFRCMHEGNILKYYLIETKIVLGKYTMNV